MALSESSQPKQKPSRPVHEWIVAGTLVVTSLAAVAALFFTRQSIQATNGQLRISEQGQITDRYNAAIANLGSRSIDIRLGGIYALQRLMQDSPRDQPTIIAVLCAFVRDRTISTPGPHKPPAFRPTTDIQAALTVVGARNTANDDSATVIDLNHTQLARGQLHGNLIRANLTGARLAGAILLGTNLTRAGLRGADLTGANLEGAHLAYATILDAHLSHTDLSGANLTGAWLGTADLRRAVLFRADLTDAVLGSSDLAGADLTRADLTRAIGQANLTGAKLSGANLTGALLLGANLTRADLTRADLTRADLAGANLSHTDLSGANLTGALWPANVAVPKGWLRDTHSGRLHRRPGTPMPPSPPATPPSPST